MRAEAVVVRRVVPGDWPALRALRLAALADSPQAFVETLADAECAHEGEWRYRATRGSEGGDSCQLLALEAGVAVATAITFPDREDPSTWWVVGVHVRPESRGRGLLARLVDGLAAEATAGKAARLRLQVHEDNARARAAYARLGFALTGEREPYPLGPGDELAMERSRPAPGDCLPGPDSGSIVGCCLGAPG